MFPQPHSHQNESYSSRAAIMATGNTAPDLHERVHSHVWWKLKTGWTDPQYVGRKNALVLHIREQWPDKKEILESGNMTDGIETLVATFDDRAWCLKTENDQTLRFEEQLRLYSKWAAVIHTERSKILESNLYNTPTTTSPKKSNIEALFNWKDTEICIEVLFSGRYPSVSTGVFHVPIMDTTQSSPIAAQWNNFSLNGFIRYVKGIITYVYAPQLHVFRIRGIRWTAIKTGGEYKIMLKRFSENAAKPKTLRLLVTDVVKPTSVKSELGICPGSLARD